MISRTDINDIVKELRKIIKSEIKVGYSIDDIVHGNRVKNVFKEYNIDGNFSGTGDMDYTTYTCTLGLYDGRVTRKNLDQDEVDGFGCTRIDVKDAYLDISIEYDEKNKIEISLSCEVDWYDRYDNWHHEYPHLKTWTILEGLHKDAIIEERYIDCQAWTHDDFEGRLVVLKPSTYKECFRTPQNLIVRATSGFGCKGSAIDRAVYYECPYDGERARTDRNEVEYVIRYECEDKIIKKYCTKEEVI